MAAPSKRKAKAAHSPLIVTLQDTRLKKFLVEALLQPEEAGQGSMTLSFNIAVIPSESTDSCGAILKIEGQGSKKDDPSKIAFSIDAEMVGLFSLSRKPSDGELESEVSLNMANFIAPVLADTIETAMIKTGYPRLKIPKNFPPRSS